MTGREIIQALHDGQYVFASAVVGMSPQWPELAKKTGIDFVFVDTNGTSAGAGIAEEDVTQLFEPFFRGDQARALPGRGVGLGLAVVDRLRQRDVLRD